MKETEQGREGKGHLVNDLHRPLCVFGERGSQPEPGAERGRFGLKASCHRCAGRGLEDQTN